MPTERNQSQAVIDSQKAEIYFAITCAYIIFGSVLSDGIPDGSIITVAMASTRPTLQKHSAVSPGTLSLNLHICFDVVPELTNAWKPEHRLRRTVMNKSGKTALPFIRAFQPFEIRTPGTVWKIRRTKRPTAPPR
jgi:hypothetical protein